MEALVLDDRSEEERADPEFQQELDLTRLQLQVRTVPVPFPSKGEVLVLVHHSPINPSDLVFLKGQYAITPKPPQVAGFECSGVVVAHGGGYKAWKLMNKRVVCRTLGGGAWGQYVVVKTDTVVPLPNDANMQTVCGLINPLTIASFAEIIQSGKHSAVVQTAAASTCGKMLFKWCLANNVPIVNIVRREEQVAQLKAIGSQHVLNQNDENFEKDLQYLCQGLNVSIAFDCVCGSSTGILLNAMKQNSTVIVYGILERGNMTGISPKMLSQQNKSIKGYLLDQYLNQKTGMSRRNFYKRAVSLMQDLFKIDVSQSFSYREFQTAKEYYLKNRSDGKVILDFTNQQIQEQR